MWIFQGSDSAPQSMLYQRLDEVNEKINTLRKKTVCPKCGFDNDEKASFCSRCGTKLGQQTASQDSAENEVPPDENSFN